MRRPSRYADLAMNELRKNPLTPTLTLCFHTPVTDPALTAEPTLRPHPRQDRGIDPVAPAIAPAPTRILRLLGVLRVLITFGNHLAVTLQANPCAETVRNIGSRFGAFDVALILARITRGLQLAQALEAKFAPRADQPDPAPRAAASAPASSPRQPRQPRTPSRPNPPCRKTAPKPSSPPCRPPSKSPSSSAPARSTPSSTDICNDLGVCMSDPLWHDINRVLMDYNGSFLPLWKERWRRFSAALNHLIPPNVRFIWPDTPPHTLHDPVVSVAIVATGPP